MVSNVGKVPLRIIDNFPENDPPQKSPHGRVQYEVLGARASMTSTPASTKPLPIISNMVFFYFQIWDQPNLTRTSLFPSHARYSTSALCRTS